jgi:hypothetical protein
MLPGHLTTAVNEVSGIALWMRDPGLAVHTCPFDDVTSVGLVIGRVERGRGLGPARRLASLCTPASFPGRRVKSLFHKRAPALHAMRTV